MNTIKISFILILLLLGSLLWIWMSVSSKKDAIEFWRQGIQTEAKVLGLDHTYDGPRGISSKYYKLSIFGEEHVVRLNYKFNDGAIIKVLVLPGPPIKVTLGDKESGLFEIYSTISDGSLWAIGNIVLDIVIVFTDVMLIIGLFNLWFGKSESTNL